MISHDLVGPQMAGAGIRSWELARVLARHVDVTLMAPRGSSAPLPEESVQVVQCGKFDSATMRKLVEPADVVVIGPGETLVEFPFLLETDKCLVMDVYDPHTLESLVWNEGCLLRDRLNSHRERLRIVNMQFTRGDFFICASERQRMLWMGWLEAIGRINPFTYDQDHALRALVDVVPIGLASSSPEHTHPLVRGVISKIAVQDPLIVWGGGIWDWLDPLTLIEAVALVAETRPKIRLYFPGPRHPFKESVPHMGMQQAAIDLSKRKGLWNKNVFWGQWVPYHERQNYLLEADIGCSLHFETVESYFAFRTRILDYIWAGLPMIVTRGDATSEIVEKYGLGIVVGYQDAKGVAEAILYLLSRSRNEFAEGFARAQEVLSWELGAQPLVRYCQNPRRAADKGVCDDWQGTKFAMDQIVHQQQEIALLRSRIAGYEAGRFIRFTKWLHDTKQRILSQDR
jgi:glycosyltransferase involved in cell wall biosynthesis